MRDRAEDQGGYNSKNTYNIGERYLLEEMPSIRTNELDFRSFVQDLEILEILQILRIGTIQKPGMFRRGERGAQACFVYISD